jgi:UDP-N-acetylglucosamine--N-acetylmuramyl-(pentapeptide) pyrophosphoryl-undecaprenol N-acetylglucosamine transferase
LLSGGGTGGHVYPALAVVDSLKKRALERGAPLQVLYAGTATGLERRIVDKSGIAFVAIHAGGLRGLSAGRALANAAELVQGTWEATRVLRDFGADIVLATGGYASAPTIAAAWFARCPVLIYLPDIEPGLAVAWLSRLARRVAVSFAVSQNRFPPGKAVVTGYPVRAALFEHDKLASRRALGVATDQPVTLVLGGSRGAHSINAAVHDALEAMLGLTQVIHITGQQDLSWLESRRDQLEERLRARYLVAGYLDEEMVDALRAADLAVARAGAATMGEFSAAGLPSILVPYPYSGQHQDANAAYMVQRGAAVRLGDEEVHDLLAPTVVRLLNDRQTLERMGRQAHSMSVPGAADALADLLVELVGGV